jgi:TDG/mug DNA glycosylase family protein
MRMLLVGLNPSLHAARTGVGFSGPSNRGWPALERAGLARVGDRSPERLLAEQRIGMTDLVKRATRGASELTKADYEDGVTRLQRLCEWLQPGSVCIVGLSGWRAAVDRHAKEGVQADLLGGRPVYLMPNPSGLNAHVTVEGLAEHLGSAFDLGANRGT